MEIPKQEIQVWVLKYGGKAILKEKHRAYMESFL